MVGSLDKIVLKYPRAAVKTLITALRALILHSQTHRVPGKVNQVKHHTALPGIETLKTMPVDHPSEISLKPH